MILTFKQMKHNLSEGYIPTTTQTLCSYKDAPTPFSEAPVSLTEKYLFSCIQHFGPSRIYSIFVTRTYFIGRSPHK